MIRAGSTFAAVLLLLACGPEIAEPQLTPCENASQEVATCVLGTGSVLYTYVSDGDDIDIIQGAQGGFHVWGSVRVTGLNPGTFRDVAASDNPTIQFQVTELDGTELSAAGVVRRGLKVRSDGAVELVGEAVVLAIGSMDDAAWRDIVFSVVVTDSCGTEVSDSVQLRLVPGE